MKVSEKLNNRIVKFIEDNPVKIEYDYRDELSKDQVEKILDGGLMEFEEELWGYNLDYIGECERYLIEQVWSEFQSEIVEEWNQEQNKQNDFEEITDEDVFDFLDENYREYISIDMNVEGILKQAGDFTVLLKIYSNYDCCNSFDNPREPESYLSDVYSRIKTGVRRADFEYEFYNGAYGGSLFCFAFRTDLMTIVELNEQIKEGTHITIPKNTEFGFFSSFQGAGSVFEKRTYKTMTIPINGQTEYDNIGLTVDDCQHYSMREVYGSNDFISNGFVTILEEVL